MARVLSGFAVFPAGPGNTEMQVEAVAHLRPAGYAGTPDYLKGSSSTKRRKLGRDASSIKKALVSGGALFPSLARGVPRRAAWPCCKAMPPPISACVAYESAVLMGGEGMIVNENTIVEIVRTGTGEPAAEGEVGEVVVTTFNRDLSADPLRDRRPLGFPAKPKSPCGRTGRRIKGWLGRADQTTKVKGMFVHPSQIAEIARRHPGLGLSAPVGDPRAGSRML